MLCSWQYIMQCFDPIALTVGSFQIHWYAICYLLAWAGACRVTLYSEARSKESGLMSRVMWQELFWWLLLGAAVGARIGFALFYEPLFFWQYPSGLFIPYDWVMGTFAPLQGMSFHGGLIGVTVVLGVWAYKKQIALPSLTDRLVLAAPVISIFGRLGNFLNQELPGRITEVSWGVHFPGEIALRHPSTLYGIFFEGFLLLGWMLFLRRKVQTRGTLTALYLFSYGTIRFFLEYFREPDWQVQPWIPFLTQGQILSVMMVGGGAFFLWFWSQKPAIIKDN